MSYVMLFHCPNHAPLLQGEPGREMFFIHEGSVRLLSFSASGEDAVLSRGDVFGEVDTILCQRRRARCVAEGQVTLYRVSRDDIDAVLVEFPELIGMLTAKCLAREAQLRRGSSGVDARGTETPPGGRGESPHGAAETPAGLDGEASAAALAAQQKVLRRVDSRRMPLAAAAAGAATLDAPGGRLGAEAARNSSGASGQAAARWFKATTATRVVARLKENGKAASAAVSDDVPSKKLIPLTPRFVDHTPRPAAAAKPEAAPDPLAGADWGAFEARVRSVMRAQAESFVQCERRLTELMKRQDALLSDVTASSLYA